MNKEHQKRIESNLAAYRGGIRTFRETVQKFEEIVRSVYEKCAEIAGEWGNATYDEETDMPVAEAIAQAILKAGEIEE